AAGDAGGSGLGARLAQWLSAIPGCGEPAVAKVLSAVAGLTVAAAAVIPGLGPLASTPPAAAAGPAPAAFTVAALPAAVGPADTVGPTNTATALKALRSEERREGKEGRPAGCAA